MATFVRNAANEAVKVRYYIQAPGAPVKSNLEKRIHELEIRLQEIENTFKTLDKMD